MSGRRALGATLAILWTPALAALALAVSWHLGNRDDHTLVSNGTERGYVLYVPRSYDPTAPTPLVISLHGAGLWGAGQRSASRWDRVADRGRFIVAYPSALAGNGPRAWAAAPESREPGDIRFISDLIDTLRARYNIDTTRIYANGLSNGGGMSFALSCASRRRVAAVGLVGAALTMPFESCPSTEPVPAIVFHGTGDRWTPYRGGASWVAPRPFPSVPGFVAAWARRNGCVGAPVESEVAPRITRREWTRCASDATVSFYTIVDGGHTWPGGGELPGSWLGETNRDIDASAAMWDFFRRHPKP